MIQTQTALPWKQHYHGNTAKVQNPSLCMVHVSGAETSISHTIWSCSRIQSLCSFVTDYYSKFPILIPDCTNYSSNFGQVELITNGLTNGKWWPRKHYTQQCLAPNTLESVMDYPESNCKAHAYSSDSVPTTSHRVVRMSLAAGIWPRPPWHGLPHPCCHSDPCTS